MIDKPHLLLPPPRSAGARDTRQAAALAERASRVGRGGYRQNESSGNGEAGRTAHFPEHVAARQLAQDESGRTRLERRVAGERRGAAPRQLLSDTMRPQRRASDDFPISTFMALHIAQEVLPDSALHLDPKLYGHPGPAFYRAAQDSLAAVPRALSLTV